jgi:hypothetical protein
MLTGELRNQIDGIWNDFWSGGLSNPLQVIEQITYLIFIKRLDEMQELEERKATTLGKPIEPHLPRGQGRARRAVCEPALLALQAFCRPGNVPHRRRARLPVHPRTQQRRYLLCPPHARRPLSDPGSGAARQGRR